MITIMNKIRTLLFFASIVYAHTLVCMETYNRQPQTSHRFHERARSEQIDANLAQLSSKYSRPLAAVQNQINAIDDKTKLPRQLCREWTLLRFKEDAVERTQSNFNEAIKREYTVSMAVAYTARECDFFYGPTSPELVQEVKCSLNVHAPLPGSSSK
jgi:hypothetical protein